MEEFDAGVRELHERVGRLDDLLRQAGTVTDLADRRSDAAHEQAEKNHRRIRRLWIAGLIVAFLWTPTTAYSAVWLHERVRNHCYPGVVYAEPARPGGEPWYCGAFPGTGRPDHAPPP